MAGGFTGGIAAAMLNGIRRGPSSNEAGMGSAPNVAATATVSHPVKQGLIQSLGVFVDTMVVCTATAFIILVSGPEVYDPATSRPTGLRHADRLSTAVGTGCRDLVFAAAEAGLPGDIWVRKDATTAGG